MDQQQQRPARGKGPEGLGLGFPPLPEVPEGRQGIETER